MPSARSISVCFLALALAGCKLNFDSGSNGTIVESSLGYECSGECTEEPPTQFSANYVAVPNPDYQFAGWSGNACNSDARRLNPECPVLVVPPIAELGMPWNLEAEFTRQLREGISKDNEYFAVTNVGFGGYFVDEQAPVTCYPTIDDCGAAGTLWIEACCYGTGDFNADGWEDLISQAALNNGHTRDTKPGPVIFLNDGKGGLYRDDAIFVNGKSEDLYGGYRLGVADFNGDGKDDFVISVMGMISREPQNYKESIPERIPLYLSTEDGKLQDASHQIEGQEDGGPIPTWQFGHDLAVGDIDGDGDQDFFQGHHLFINNGEGVFSQGSLPVSWPGYFPIGSSLIDDFDGDGIGDLLISYSYGDIGSQSWLFLSDGDSGMEQRTGILNPEGFYGPINTNYNHAASHDIDGDGDKDIVHGQTRIEPYYRGRALQILINDGNGNFSDESDQRIEQTDIASEVDGVGSWGEGAVRLLDVNGDGHIDIFDRNSAKGGYDNGIDIWLNNGAGQFIRVPQSDYPYVEPRDLLVRGGSNNRSGRLEDGVPIDLDKKAGIDIVSYLQTNTGPFRQSSETTLYTLTSKKALKASDYVD
jgi:hypothetical protein